MTLYKRINLVFCILFLFANLSFAQNKITVGSKAPEIVFQKALPNPGYKIARNKSIILDFWATWCAPCVLGLIKSNEFVEKYASQIEFIAITDETSSNVREFIKKRNFKHHFIIDKAVQTTTSFHVTGIPKIFLIDKNNVIQWIGSSITTELIDEFLKNGCIETKKELLNKVSLKSIINIQARKELSLQIDEFPIANFEYSASERFKPDTFECIYNRIPLKEIIVNLNNTEKDKTIFNISDKLENKRISMKYQTNNCNVQNEKEYLTKSLGHLYSFDTQRKDIDTLVWEISVVDTLKLYKHRTIMTSKFSGMDKGKMTDKLLTKESNSLNLSLPTLANEIGNSYNLICESTDKINEGFDFIKINGSEFNTLKNQLFNKYGLKLTARKKNINFIIVTEQ